MKANSTIKHILLAFTIALGMTACKKDKKDPDPVPPAEVKMISLSDLKALSTGASVKVPDAKKIAGILISDVSNKNIDSKTVVLQDAATQTGIIISFDAAQTFAAGDQLEVNVSNQTLAQVNGEVVLQNVPAANAKKTGTGTITAKATTAAEIATNKTAWDGTLVTIAATGLTGGSGKYAGTLTIADASGTVSSKVLAGAAFENTAYPVSVSSITGIVRVIGTDVSVDIRKTADVVSGAVTRIVTEMFENVLSNNDTDPNTAFIQSAQGFSTSIGIWRSGIPSTAQHYLIPGATYDPGYTTAGRSYIYMAANDKDYLTGDPVAELTVVNANTLMYNANNLKGLKTVSVTFAASKGSDFSLHQWRDRNKFHDYVFNAPFNESTDYAQIGIGIVDQDAYSVGTLPDATFLTKSPQYKKAGEFYTYTWTVPTKEQLIAAGLDAANADKYLENPYFVIYNLSKVAGATPTYKSFSPILIDKVVMGFSE